MEINVQNLKLVGEQPARFLLVSTFLGFYPVSSGATSFTTLESLMASAAVGSLPLMIGTVVQKDKKPEKAMKRSFTIAIATATLILTAGFLPSVF